MNFPVASPFPSLQVKWDSCQRRSDRKPRPNQKRMEQCLVTVFTVRGESYTARSFGGCVSQAPVHASNLMIMVVLTRRCCYISVAGKQPCSVFKLRGCLFAVCHLARPREAVGQPAERPEYRHNRWQQSPSCTDGISQHGPTPRER